MQLTIKNGISVSIRIQGTFRKWLEARKKQDKNMKYHRANLEICPKSKYRETNSSSSKQHRSKHNRSRNWMNQSYSVLSYMREERLTSTKV